MSSGIKILAPLNQKSDVASFAQAGVDQFYLGYHDLEWMESFGQGADINRMSSFGNKANSFEFKEAIKVAKEISSLGKECYITLNANLYSEKQTDFLRKRLEEFKNAQVTGIILSEPCLVDCVRKLGMKAVASTMLGIYNSDILDFYRKKGFSRVIIPRECSLDDIYVMHEKFPEVEFEVFYLRNGCIYSDSNCLINHGFGGICTDLRRREGYLSMSCKSTVDKETLEESINLYNSRLYNKIACGHCALFDLIRAGASSLKIVGRADKSLAVLDDIILTKRNIEVANSVSSRDEYLKRMIKPSYEKTNCQDGFNCYYRKNLTID